MKKETSELWKKFDRILSYRKESALDNYAELEKKIEKVLALLDDVKEDEKVIEKVNFFIKEAEELQEKEQSTMYVGVNNLNDISATCIDEYDLFTEKELDRDNEVIISSFENEDKVYIKYDHFIDYIIKKLDNEMIGYYSYYRAGMIREELNSIPDEELFYLGKGKENKNYCKTKKNIL